MSSKKPVVYAFIDSQNLNLGVSRDVVTRKGRVLYKGQKLDFKKFHDYLRAKFGVSQAYLFIGYIPTNTSLYAYLQECGYTLILKDASAFLDEEGRWVTKGNVDVDLALHAAAVVADQYDRAVFVSGDGDFATLYRYIEKQGKLHTILVPNRYRYSKLLNHFRPQLKFVSDLPTLFTQKKSTKSGGRSKALGLLGRSDKPSIAQQGQNVKKGEGQSS